MAADGYPPVPPELPQMGAQQFPAPPVAGAATWSPVAVAPDRKSRAWMWWSFGILAMVALIITSCTLPFVFLGSQSDGLDVGGDAVAVIRVDGVIAGTGDVYSGYVTPESFYDQLDQAAEDDSVKALVLRVDSPGGTVAASEEIAQYVSEFEKPVVVSIGDIGASGAYMISSQADEIIAMAGSAVGSIGVISEIPNVSELLGKVGVEFQVITAGKNKDTGSPYRPLSNEERALIQGEVDDAYGQFIDIVAKGRKMERSKVESLATGWVWSGDKALELGLIDTIGTYQHALDVAAKRGGIKGDDYEVITYDSEDFGQILSSLMGINDSLRSLSGFDASREATIRRTVPR